MTARDFALIQLDRLALPGWQPNLLRRGDPKAPEDMRDLALAEQIRVGVIKNLGLLDFLTDHYTNHRRNIDPLVRKVLAIALYQLRLLTRIPESAAVDQAVEQVRRFGRPHAAGFVNAILRRATREPDVPLPDEQKDPREYAWVVLSHPVGLFDRLVELLGIEKAIQFCRHDNTEPPTIVRAFRGVEFPPRGLSDDIRVIPHELAGMFVVQGAKRALFAEWAHAGVAQVQDPTAARVVPHLDLKPNLNLLDRCAGLGTKTLQIQDQLAGTGWIMAIDPSEPRCNALQSLVRRRKIENVAVIQAAMLRQIPELKRPAFDRILVDAPCSNSGVLTRRPEARYAQEAASLASLTKLQDDILNDCTITSRPAA